MKTFFFLEAIRLLKLKNPQDVLTVMVSYLSDSRRNENQTTQHAVNELLNGAGIQPDVIIAQSTTFLDKKRKEKFLFSVT